MNLSVALENVVCNELFNKGYKVYVGKAKKGEIDFVAIKNNETKYIQVTCDLSDEITRNREVSAFDEFESDNKYIITLDKNRYNVDGIKVLNIYDFLLDEDF